MDTKELLKGFTFPSFSLVKYLNSLTEDEKERCVICENKEIARLFRQISYKGFVSKEDIKQLNGYYPLEDFRLLCTKRNN